MAVGRPPHLAALSYAASNPARFIDPNGRSPWIEKELRGPGGNATHSDPSYGHLPAAVTDRVQGAGRLYADVQMFGTGVAACTNPVTCILIGLPVMTVTLDDAYAASQDTIFGGHHQTVLGKHSSTIGEGEQIIIGGLGLTSLFDGWSDPRPRSTPSVHGGGPIGGGGGGAGPNGPLPPVIYRKGGSNPGSLKLREGEQGLSFRDSLSNPIEAKDAPVFPVGSDYIGVDPSKLPAGCVICDNIPPGHVTVTATFDQIKAAIVVKGKLPKD